MEKMIEMLLANGIAQFVAWVASIGGASVAIPLLLEYVKNIPQFSFITPYTSTINRIVAVTTGTLTAMGISATFNGAAGQIVIDGVTFQALAKLVTAIATQLGLQQIVYKKLIASVGR